MESTKSVPLLYNLEQRVRYHAGQFERNLPEMRFFVLDSLEFMSLLEKHVYPVSPVNIWEGKRMVTRKYRVETGQESSLYYEVVQTGNPSYAYLNHTNSPMMQASVMAHVCGHCEFSELNVLQDSTHDRTEFVMYLVRKADLARQQMGEEAYRQFWNASESIIPFIAPHSRFNLARAIDTDVLDRQQETDTYVPETAGPSYFQPYSDTLDSLMKKQSREDAWHKEMQTKMRQETLSLRGYKLRAPCQDIFGFLKNYAPASQSEKSLLNYFYTVYSTHDFIMRTQIMNEGWAMYWEKKIMLELFKERSVTGIIDYAKVFSGVCYPRPYYRRNPYHLGFYLWTHIEELYREGKVSLDYLEEKDRELRNQWNRPDSVPPIQRMEHLVRTVTDYEFLRRFLTPKLIHEFHLNRFDKREAQQLGISSNHVIQADKQWVWVDPEPIKEEMLDFFTHFYRPRIYVIDADFQDGGLLLYHRDDGRSLKKTWIKPTLKNLNHIWKGPVSLITKNWLYTYSANLFKETVINSVSFDEVQERIQQEQKPFKL
ncbi:MAG: SpoVR family protein [SAR324 cluster bacterium]|nr:SpoVR family protein [SAR324 cluster bacterium]